MKRKEQETKEEKKKNKKQIKQEKKQQKKEKRKKSKAWKLFIKKKLSPAVSLLAAVALALFCGMVSIFLPEKRLIFFQRK